MVALEAIADKQARVTIQLPVQALPDNLTTWAYSLASSSYTCLINRLRGNMYLSNLK